MSIKNLISNGYAKTGVLATLVMSSSAFASQEGVSTNYLDALVQKVDVAPIITGVVSVAALVMSVAVVVMGLKKVAHMLNAF